MIYFAIPYTRQSSLWRECYFMLGCHITAELFAKGEQVFTPIVYTHQISLRYPLPIDWEFWQEFDEAFLARCDELYVLDVPGVAESAGVQAEIAFAKAHDLHITYVDPYTYGFCLERK